MFTFQETGSPAQAPADVAPQYLTSTALLRQRLQKGARRRSDAGFDDVPPLESDASASQVVPTPSPLPQARVPTHVAPPTVAAAPAESRSAPNGGSRARQRIDQARSASASSALPDQSREPLPAASPTTPVASPLLPTGLPRGVTDGSRQRGAPARGLPNGFNPADPRGVEAAVEAAKVAKAQQKDQKKLDFEQRRRELYAWNVELRARFEHSRRGDDGEVFDGV
jgi:hypothetical protein